MRKFIPLFENFENHLSSNNWEYVKTDTLWQYKEFDRSVDIKNSDSLDNIKRLEQILSEEGFNQPLILQYSKKYQTAYLTEGNHRLVAAKNMGIKYIPVRVTTDGGDKKDAKRVFGSVDNPTLPSQIGIESYDKDYNLIYIDDEYEELSFEQRLSSFPDVISYKHTFKDNDYIYDISIKLNSEHDVLLLFTSDEAQRIEACMSFRGDLSPDDLWAKINFDNFASTYDNRDEIDEEFYENYRKTKYESYLYGNCETPFGGYWKWIYDEKTMLKKVGIEIYSEPLNKYDFDGFGTFFECLKYNYNKKMVL